MPDYSKCSIMFSNFKNLPAMNPLPLIMIKLWKNQIRETSCEGLAFKIY